jgi:hypothetical protein
MVHGDNEHRLRIVEFGVVIRAGQMTDFPAFLVSTEGLPALPFALLSDIPVVVCSPEAASWCWHRFHCREHRTPVF